MIPTPMHAPEISVVVPSHDRPVRLRWLLNALEEQTLPTERWEVVVGHDSSGPETERLLTEHPLAKAGVLRHVALPPNSAPPGRNRNAALGLARAPLIAFTDDDCRPPADWLEKALAAARRHPGAIVQGETIKDPHEENIEANAWFHSNMAVPPTPWAECCNIVYPREWLDRAGGFREDVYTGEDTDLAMRCRALGAEYVGARDVLTYHAIIDRSLPAAMRGAWRWKDLPILFKRHPSLRDSVYFWIFWKRTHLFLPPLLAGAWLSRRNPLWLALAVPWMLHGMTRHGTDPRGRLRGLAEVPGKLAIDGVEMAALATGSVKHRTLLL